MRFPILALALALGGCIAPPPALTLPGVPDPLVIPGRGVDPRPCGADRLSVYLGEPVTRLWPIEPTGAVRILRPGDSYTEDFSPTRLNVSLDSADHIAAFTCG
jgi:hypothetical protein